VQFRFTIFHDDLYPIGVVVDEPEGWDKARLVLDRHEDFHSLVERFEGEFIWYGSAHEVLREIELGYGVDSEAGLLIEISIQTGVWEDLFSGLIKLSQLEHKSNSKFYKMKVPIIRDDFWTKFINRRGTPVNLLDTEDVDGEARTLVDKITLPLPSQVIRQKFERQTNWNDDNLEPFDNYIIIAPEYQANTTYYLIFDNSRTLIDEVKNRFDNGLQISTENPLDVSKYLWKVENDGNYDFVTKVRFLLYNRNTENFGLPGEQIPLYIRTFTITWFFTARRNGVLDTPTPFLIKSGSLGGGPASPLINMLIWDDNNDDWNINLNLSAGDEVYIWGEISISEVPDPPPDPELDFVFLSDYNFDPNQTVQNYIDNDYSFVLGSARYTELKLTANTTFQQTSTDAFLLKDAFESVISKITGRDSVIISDYFATCKRLYAVMLGLHVRGYPMDEKIFSRSFNDLWEGADPCFNLGLAYEGEQIRIEEKNYFYNKEPIVNLSNLFGITRIYDQDYFIKSFEAGFQTWSLESESGIDDQQTKRIYRSKLKSLGKDFKNLSGFLAASLAIEQTRRNRIEEGKDWRGDEEIMIIALKAIEGGYTPELGSDFTTITNLLNSDSRYNVRLGVGFLIDRWMDWLSGSLALFPDKYYFASGEGNYSTEVTKPVSDCDGSGSIVENQDFQVSSENFIKLPHRYQYTHPMSFDIYKIIRDNRHNALGLSRSDAFYTPHHIHKMEYLIVEGKAEFVVDLAVIPTEENGFRYLEDDNFVIFGTEGLLFQDLEEILYQDGETALVGLDT
jgi:hypothetical protein